MSVVFLNVPYFVTIIIMDSNWYTMGISLQFVGNFLEIIYALVVQIRLKEYINWFVFHQLMVFVSKRSTQGEFKSDGYSSTLFYF